MGEYGARVRTIRTTGDGAGRAYGIVTGLAATPDEALAELMRHAEARAESLDPRLWAITLYVNVHTLQRRRVSIRSWSFSRWIALGAIRIPTRGPPEKNPNPSSVACAARRIEDFPRFTFSFSRRPVTPQTLSNTL